MNPRRLYRSRDRQLAGVAGGMAEYLDIDPTIARILWIVAGLMSAGLALLAYFVLALVIPQQPYAPAAGPSPWAAAGSPGGWSAAPGGAPTYGPPTAGPAWGPAPGSGYAAYAAQPSYARRAESRGIGAGAIFGVVLIVIGGIALADAAVPGWIAGAVMGPAVLLALGAALLLGSIRRRPEDGSHAGTASATTSGPQPTPAAAWAAADAATAPGAAPRPDAAPSWDVTDTQAVFPAVDAASPSMPPADPAGEGDRPA